MVDDQYNLERGPKFFLTGNKRMGLYMVDFLVLPLWLMVGEPIPEEEGLLDGWIVLDNGA